MTFVSADLYATIEQSIPIACVDFVPTREGRHGQEVGLILRDSPFGRVWCHLGGRILRGETIRQAILRHAEDTLAVGVALPQNPQPDYVYQWFPPDIAPHDGTVHGDDPRKHAIGLSYLVEFDGAPRPREEALDFSYFPPSELPAPLWPGSEELLRELLNRRQTT